MGAQHACRLEPVIVRRRNSSHGDRCWYDARVLSRGVPMRRSMPEKMIACAGSSEYQ